jgi:hypothetical protein
MIVAVAMSVVVSVDSVAHAERMNKSGAEDEVFIQLMCIGCVCVF